MEEKNQKGSGFAWPSAAVIAALAATLAHNGFPLRSSRPEEKAGHEHTARGDQTIEARLWQDPFAAVDAYHRKQAEDAAKPRPGRNPDNDREAALHSTNEVIQQIGRKIAPQIGDGTNVVVYFVMVSNGSYVEDSERRMRTRYAAVSGLGVAGYVPWDEDHIGYFEIHWPRGSYYETNRIENLPSIAHRFRDPLAVPFEWFQPNPLSPPATNQEAVGAVLLLWLDRDAFSDYPTRRLSELVEILRGTENGSKTNARLHFKLLDPSLGDILQEPFATSKDYPETGPFLAVSNKLQGIQVYSSWSTTADALLVTNATVNRREIVSTELANRGYHFFNVTATDAELADRLIRELNRRGVDPARDNIALISESDTYYGRALPLTFAASVMSVTQSKNSGGFFKKVGVKFSEMVDIFWNVPHPVESSRRGTIPELSKIVHQLKAGSISWPENLHLSSYLRGVDGRLPGEVAPKDDSGEQKDKTKELRHLERPEGPTQLDYMPRLALELREHEKENEKKGESRFKAIGILGSDVYDKLLLLQSLHKLFPGTLFFTTDLDARLLHPTELKWSRNLLVASSFDLKLNDADDGRNTIPPFRDSYQTGQYLATLVAFGRQDPGCLTNIRPRLFEVGQNGAYILARPHPKAREDAIYPERPSLYPGD